MALIALLMALTPLGSVDEIVDHDRLPRAYLCVRAPGPVVVDGRIDESEWGAAPWTVPFRDIEGGSKPAPPLETRARMLWDDQFLYVAAWLEEPHVWGTLTEKNSVIYYDNDFEIFIDPDGDNHNYYEFEMNALGTIWELTLPMPYKDGGQAVLGTNLDGLQSAVDIAGTLNDPADVDTHWTVEVAIPWEGLAVYAGGNAPPEVGDQWRINFSRVEWQHVVTGGSYEKVPDTPEDNWVWSPQGVINMHRPETWAYVQFAGTEDDGPVRPDVTAPSRELLMGLYYAQRDYREKTGSWANSLEELLQEGDDPRHASVSLSLTADGFHLRTPVSESDGSKGFMNVDHTSRLWRTE